jgi:hypothetical protein
LPETSLLNRHSRPGLMRENTIVEWSKDDADGHGFVELIKMPIAHLQLEKSVHLTDKLSCSRDDTHDSDGLVYKIVKHSWRVSSDRDPGEVYARYTVTVSASHFCFVKDITSRAEINGRIERIQTQIQIRMVWMTDDRSG